MEQKNAPNTVARTDCNNRQCITARHIFQKNFKKYKYYKWELILRKQNKEQ